MSEGRLRLPSPACLSSVLVGVCTRTLAVHFSRFSVGGVAKPSAVDLFGTPGSCSMFIHACVRVCGWSADQQASEQVPRPSLDSGGEETLHGGGKVGEGIQIQGSLMIAYSRELTTNLYV